MFYSHAFPSQIVCSERGWGEREKRGRGGGEKKENIGLVLRFFTFAVCPFLKLYFFFFFFSGSAFVLNEAFLLSSCIFRVKGLLCAFLLDLRFWGGGKSAPERWNVR